MSPHFPPLSKKKEKTRKRKKQQQQQHPYERLVKFRKNMGEADVKRKARMKTIADFLQKVLPEPSSHTETDAKKKKKKATVTFRSRDADGSRSNTLYFGVGAGGVIRDA